MTDAPKPNPENIIADGDPGDETARRYRYQWTWAAIVCCMLLDDTLDVKEVFCEHHEDVLLKHQDGSFTGHQVKTRSSDQALWKANDEAVWKACARFAKLEAEYPGRFRRFCFFTNHPLYAKGNGNDLSFVLKSIKDAATVADLPQKVARWLRRVAQGADVSEEDAFAAMSKTIAKDDLPKLQDVFMRLINALAQCWPPAAECPHESVGRAGRALIDECGRASSLDHEQLLPAYVIAAMEQDEQIAARIDGKRMTLERVQTVLAAGRDSTATLEGDPALYITPGEGSPELLHQKLDAGGFSIVSINSADDLRDKADYLGLKWINQHGNARGLIRYNHVRSLVLSDAGRAFDATQNEKDGFGPAMREYLRRLFHLRRIAGDQLYDATDDHLEGFAFSLTAQCEIDWSRTRPWESQ